MSDGHGRTPSELVKRNTLAPNGDKVTGDVLGVAISNSPETEYAGDVANQNQYILIPTRPK